jgi:hypothetical protein
VVVGLIERRKLVQNGSASDGPIDTQHLTHSIGVHSKGNYHRDRHYAAGFTNLQVRGLKRV